MILPNLLLFRSIFNDMIGVSKKISTLQIYVQLGVLTFPVPAGPDGEPPNLNVKACVNVM